MNHRVLTTPWRATATGALLLALLLAAACSGSDDSQDSGDAGGAPPDEAALPASGEDAVSGTEGGSDPNLPAVSERKIALNATVRLRVDDIPQAVQDVEDIASGAGGFVSGSDVAIDRTGDATQQATMSIRVPASAYTSVVRQLRGIASQVDSETSRATEVTDEYTDLQARLRNLEATEARYLDLLNRAQSVEEILAVQDRLGANRLEIEQVQGRLNVLNDLTDLATINVELSLPPLVARGETQGWAEEAVETSWAVSRAALQVFGTLAIATAFLLPWLLVPTLVSAVAWRLFGRRISGAVERIAKL